jgi:hypothetical protein
MAVALDEPLLVVTLDEGGDLALGVRKIFEAVQPQALLLQRPHEALDHPVRLRAIRLACSRREAVVAREVLEDRMPEDRAGAPPEDLRARIIVQAFERHAAEVAKRPLVPVEQDGEPLVRVRVGKHRREKPSVKTNRCTVSSRSPIQSRVCPKSTCACCPGGVSKRIVATAAQRRSSRFGFT